MGRGGTYQTLGDLRGDGVGSGACEAALMEHRGVAQPGDVAASAGVTRGDVGATGTHKVVPTIRVARW